MNKESINPHITLGIFWNGTGWNVNMHVPFIKQTIINF